MPINNLTTATFSGTTTISVAGGNNLTLEKAGGAALNFTKSGTNSVLFEDDGGKVGMYNWSGSAWSLQATIGNSGIKFGGGASTLAYYEEGSWTPQLYAGATAFTMSGINAGKYIRIGNQVTVCGHLQWSAGSGSGMVQIRGLPFTSSGVRTAGSIGASPYGISYDAGYGMWILVNDPSTAYIYIIEQSSSGAGYSHTPPVASSGIIYGFAITYFLL
jgi:hypothetical protein